MAVQLVTTSCQSVASVTMYDPSRVLALAREGAPLYWRGVSGEEGQTPSVGIEPTVYPR